MFSLVPLSCAVCTALLLPVVADGSLLYCRRCDVDGELQLYEDGPGGLKRRRDVEHAVLELRALSA